MGLKDEIRPVGPSFTQTLALVMQLEPGQMIPPTIVQGLSELLPTQIIDMYPVWESLTAEVKRDLMTALIEASETDFATDFALLGIMALDDSDADVRCLAIDLCVHVTSQRHAEILLEMAQNDEAETVRAGAIRALGAFVLEGEFGKLDAALNDSVVDYLLRVAASNESGPLVRSRAIESLGYSSHPRVAKQISRAYESGEPMLKTASIFAMGVSSDARWRDHVIHELERGTTEDRYEAARAAGELELAEAVRPLSEIALAEERQLAGAAIWSLGEIGGKEAVRVLEALAERAGADEDDDLLDMIEDALDSANAAAGLIPGFETSDDE
ncbi:MAG: HEAT repeat domain-containing protein [Chloroflexi bacterium]|nr:HEAT repeat domain-containing protein [Chloroflexota bacterium]